jgi:hypothetical protein
MGPRVRKLICDEEFAGAVRQIERKLWADLKNVIHNFLGNNRRYTLQNNSQKHA